MEHSPGQIIPWVTNQALVNLRKLKSYQVSSPSTMLRPDINYRKKDLKNKKIWRLNNILLNHQEITEEIKEEIKKKLRNI